MDFKSPGPGPVCEVGWQRTKEQCDGLEGCDWTQNENQWWCAPAADGSERTDCRFLPDSERFYRCPRCDKQDSDFTGGEIGQGSGQCLDKSCASFPEVAHFLVTQGQIQGNDVKGVNPYNRQPLLLSQWIRGSYAPPPEGSECSLKGVEGVEGPRKKQKLSMPVSKCFSYNVATCHLNVGECTWCGRMCLPGGCLVCRDKEETKQFLEASLTRFLAQYGESSTELFSRVPEEHSWQEQKDGRYVSPWLTWWKLHSTYEPRDIEQARQSFVRAYEDFLVDCMSPARPGLGRFVGKFRVLPTAVEPASFLNLPRFQIEVDKRLICPRLPYKEI